MIIKTNTHTATCVSAKKSNVFSLIEENMYHK